MFTGRTDVEAETPILWSTWCKELTHLRRPWCWERLSTGGEGDDRGWDGWMAPPTQWTWVWVNSRSWWWTARPGVLQFMGSQRVGQDWATELRVMMVTPKKYIYFYTLKAAAWGSGFQSAWLRPLPLENWQHLTKSHLGTYQRSPGYLDNHKALRDKQELGQG